MNGVPGESALPWIPVAGDPRHGHGPVDMEEPRGWIDIVSDPWTKQWHAMESRAMVPLDLTRNKRSVMDNQAPTLKLSLEAMNGKKYKNNKYEIFAYVRLSADCVISITTFLLTFLYYVYVKTISKEIIYVSSLINYCIRTGEI